MGSGDVTQPGGGQVQAGFAVRERAHHTGAAAYLAHDPLQRVVRAQLDPMAVWEPVVGQRFVAAVFQQFRRLRQLHSAQVSDHGFHLLSRRLAIFLGVDGFQHLRHSPHLAGGYQAEDVAVEVHHGAVEECRYDGWFLRLRGRNVAPRC